MQANRILLATHNLFRCSLVHEIGIRLAVLNGIWAGAWNKNQKLFNPHLFSFFIPGFVV